MTTANWFGVKASWRSVAQRIAIVFIPLAAYYYSPLGDITERNVSRRAEFTIRHALDQAPPVDPRIKILAYDDRSLYHFGRPDLTLHQWNALLVALEARKPQVILIDKVFSVVPREPGLSELATTLERLADIVVLGITVFDRPIRNRPAMPLELPAFSLKVLTPGATDEGYRDAISSADFLASSRKRTFVYGAHESLRHGRLRSGHISYESGQILPFYRTGTDTGVPYMGLLASASIRVRDGKLFVSDTQVPLDHRQRLDVNLVPPANILSQASHSLLAQIMKSEAGEPLDVVSQGDVVLILPNFFTGSTDFTDTPVGRIPGGLVLSAVVNSALTGQWLTPVPGGIWLILLATLLGGVMGKMIPASRFPYLLAAILFAVVSLSLAAFVFLGWIVPWLFIAAGVGISSLVVFMYQTRLDDESTTRLRDALEGSMAPEKLTQLLKNPHMVAFDGIEQVVTLMFVDVVGYSLTSEQLTPKEAFARLRDLLTGIAQIIHECGGVLDKTLGDGLLCYFGYNYDGSTYSDHVDRAVECAIRIQRQSLQDVLNDAGAQPIYPLRIGINTTSVFVGNLGTSGRLDFTIIGNGVNYAKRLEAAANSFSIMLGRNTYLSSAKFRDSPAVTKSLILVKHHDELMEAFELNPFFDDPDLLRRGVTAYRKFFGLDRSRTRWQVEFESISVNSNYGEGWLVDFSDAGLGICLPDILAKGVTLNLELNSTDGSLRGDCLEHALLPIVCDVRWARAVDGGFLHGLQIRNLNRSQRALLVGHLNRCTMRKIDSF